MTYFTDFFLGIIAQLYLFTNNLGLALIIFTILLRLILVPLTLPSLKSATKIREIQPLIKKLKEKHKKDKDKKVFQQAQLELYKKYNVNPLSGCLPQIVQIVILILLYQVLIKFLNNPTINGLTVNTSFLWLDLAIPDRSGVLPVLAAGTQLILSLMIAPGAEKDDIVPNQSKSKKVQEANKKEEDFADMAGKMQQQIVFIMPVMTGIIAFQFPSGLAIYWIATTVFSIGQQYYISGFGGLKTYYQRAMTLVKGRLL
jgi:YidC/Oxa1 family membrane protein insertase